MNTESSDKLHHAQIQIGRLQSELAVGANAMASFQDAYETRQRELTDAIVDRERLSERSDRQANEHANAASRLQKAVTDSNDRVTELSR